MNAPARLQAILDYENLNATALSKSLGFDKPQRLYDVINGKVKNISGKLADIILHVYPYYNKVWLLTGVGEMLNNPQGDTTNTIEEEQRTVPLVPFAAMGGQLTGFALEGVTRNQCELIKSPIEGADFAIPITGDSMEPEFPRGSRVLVQAINPNSFIEWGKVYVLDTCNGIVIKQLRKSDKDGCVSCFSINDNSIYAPFDVPLADIHGIYRVLLCLELK